jgi:hypothetical protein
MDNVKQAVKNLINFLINSNKKHNIQWQIITGIHKEE